MGVQSETCPGFGSGGMKISFKKMIEAFKNDPQIKAEQIDGLGLGVPYHQTLGDGLLYKGSKRI